MRVAWLLLLVSAVEASGRAIAWTSSAALEKAAGTLFIEELESPPVKKHGANAESWWGSEASLGSAFSSLGSSFETPSRSPERGAELGRTAELMRRQLGEHVYSYFYEPPPPHPRDRHHPRQRGSRENQREKLARDAPLAGEVDYHLGLFDAGGDGWNGATFSITDSDHTAVAIGTLEGGFEGIEKFQLEDGTYTITFGGGSTDSEISMSFLPSEENFPIGCSETGTCTVTVILLGGRAYEATQSLTMTTVPTFVETATPTTHYATQLKYLRSAVLVTDVNEVEFELEGHKVIQYSFNDVMMKMKMKMKMVMMMVIVMVIVMVMVIIIVVKTSYHCIDTRAPWSGTFREIKGVPLSFKEQRTYDVASGGVSSVPPLSSF